MNNRANYTIVPAIPKADMAIAHLKFLDCSRAILYSSSNN